MKGFPGFPDGKLRQTAIPNLFFSDLLPHIDNLAEMKITLYAFWALTQKEGQVRYLRFVDFPGPQAVTILISQYFCLAINQLDCTLCT